MALARDRKPTDAGGMRMRWGEDLGLVEFVGESFHHKSIVFSRSICHAS